MYVMDLQVTFLGKTPEDFLLEEYITSRVQETHVFKSPSHRTIAGTITNKLVIHGYGRSKSKSSRIKMNVAGGRSSPYSPSTSNGKVTRDCATPK